MADRGRRRLAAGVRGRQPAQVGGRAGVAGDEEVHHRVGGWRCAAARAPAPPAVPPRPPRRRPPPAVPPRRRARRAGRARRARGAAQRPWCPQRRRRCPQRPWCRPRRSCPPRRWCRAAPVAAARPPCRPPRPLPPRRRRPPARRCSPRCRAVPLPELSPQPTDEMAAEASIPRTEFRSFIGHLRSTTSPSNDLRPVGASLKILAAARPRTAPACRRA